LANTLLQSVMADAFEADSAAMLEHPAISLPKRS
jgi:hypothetical protein